MSDIDWVSNKVYWLDPDEDTCSGWGVVHHVENDVYHIKLDSGGEVEAYRHELHIRKP